MGRGAGHDDVMTKRAAKLVGLCLFSNDYKEKEVNTEKSKAETALSQVQGEAE